MFRINAQTPPVAATPAAPVQGATGNPMLDQLMAKLDQVIAELSQHGGTGGSDVFHTGLGQGQSANPASGTIGNFAPTAQPDTGTVHKGHQPKIGVASGTIGTHDPKTHREGGNRDLPPFGGHKLPDLPWRHAPGTSPTLPYRPPVAVEPGRPFPEPPTRTGPGSPPADWPPARACGSSPGGTVGTRTDG